MVAAIACQTLIYCYGVIMLGGGALEVGWYPAFFHLIHLFLFFYPFGLVLAYRILQQKSILRSVRNTPIKGGDVKKIF
jgi:hypothetical protein